MRDVTYLSGLVACLFLAAGLLASQEKRWNYVLFGFGWFLLFLVPSLIRPYPHVCSDFIEHRLYLPMIGLIPVSSNGFYKRKWI